MSEWIPVSKPPEINGRYLVSMRYLTHDTVETASYSTDLHKVDKWDFPKHEAGWYNYDSEYGYYKIENVIVAYMPLPEPYKSSPTGAESEGDTQHEQTCNTCKHSDNGLVDAKSGRCEACYYDGRLKGNCLWEGGTQE